MDHGVGVNLFSIVTEFGFRAPRYREVAAAAYGMFFHFCRRSCKSYALSVQSTKHFQHIFRFDIDVVPSSELVETLRSRCIYCINFMI